MPAPANSLHNREEKKGKSGEEVEAFLSREDGGKSGNSKAQQSKKGIVWKGDMYRLSALQFYVFSTGK